LTFFPRSGKNHQIKIDLKDSKKMVKKADISVSVFCAGKLVQKISEVIHEDDTEEDIVRMTLKYIIRRYLYNLDSVIIMKKDIYNPVGSLLHNKTFKFNCDSEWDPMRLAIIDYLESQDSDND
jgi:hypothetical protein